MMLRVSLPRSGIAFLVGLSFLMAGCSDPRNYEVKKLTEEQRKEIGTKLTADEGQKLTGWMMRNSFSGKDIPDGITISQALKDQDSWLAKQKEEEAKAAELKKRVEAERKAKQDEFAKLASVAVVGKSNHEEGYSRRFVEIDVAFENKSDKDILGIKGTLKIADMFGDKILNMGWSFDKGVAAKQTAVERGTGVSINQFIERHKKLWATDMDKLKFSFDIEKIIFKDGTSVEAPE